MSESAANIVASRIEMNQSPTPPRAIENNRRPATSTATVGRRRTHLTRRSLAALAMMHETIRAGLAQLALKGDSSQAKLANRVGALGRPPGDIRRPPC